jgi:hypothetical protein
VNVSLRPAGTVDGFPTWMAGTSPVMSASARRLCQRGESPRHVTSRHM